MALWWGKGVRTVSKLNPLPCGCCAMGVQDLENAVDDGHVLHVWYKGVHVVHCQMHAAAPDLLAALKACLPSACQAESPASPNHGTAPCGKCCACLGLAAIRKAEDTGHA